MTEKVYEGSVGVVIRLATGEDISAASYFGVWVKKPSGTQVLWTGVIDPTDNTKVMYTTIVGDLEPGQYHIQAYVVYSAASYFYGDVARFKVSATFG